MIPCGREDLHSLVWEGLRAPLPPCVGIPLGQSLLPPLPQLPLLQTSVFTRGLACVRGCAHTGMSVDVCVGGV